MNAEIIAVGTEILLGDIVNTNAQHIAQGLAQLGIGVYYQTVVGDNPKRLKETIATAFARADLVVTCGGLGPTEDDLTKETGAVYFNKKLVVDQKALARIEHFFEKIQKQMTPNNRKQALVPEGCKVLYNQNGTAPGIIMEENGKIMVLLPGPPREMAPMFDEQVMPYLEDRQEETFVSRTLRIMSVGESGVEHMLLDLIDGQTNPTVATYAKDNESLVRLTACAHTKKEAKQLIDPIADEIYRRLGENIYGEDETSIEEVVARLLVEKGETIAVSESCTGGMVSSALIEFPGISKVFIEGDVTYSNDAKIRRLGVKKETLELFGAVSKETAAEMAIGIAQAAGTKIGISTTGIAGPDGGSEQKPVGLVYAGLYRNGSVKTQEFHFAGTRQRIRSRATAAVLDWLRRELITS